MAVGGAAAPDASSRGRSLASTARAAPSNPALRIPGARVAYAEGFEAAAAQPGQPPVHSCWVPLGANASAPPSRAAAPQCDIARAPAAARTGAHGLSVTVIAGGGEGDGPGSVRRRASIRISLGPVLQLLPARLYSLCTWARLNRSTSASSAVRVRVLVLNATTLSSSSSSSRSSSILAHTALHLRRRMSPYAALLTPEWRQMCVHALQVGAPVPGLLALELDARAYGEYHLDDVEVAYHDLDLEWAAPGNVASRIEAHRKRDVVLRLRGPDGRPLPPGSVARLSVSLRQHAFAFGTAADFGNSQQAGTRERRRFLTHAIQRLGLNSLTPGFRLFWPSYERRRGGLSRGRRLMDEFVEVARAAGVQRLHGHTLEWDHEDFYGHWSRLQGCQEYRDFLKRRIQRDVSYYRGVFESYDVVNEPFMKLRYLAACTPGDRGDGDASAVLLGVVADAHRWAAAADPGAQLCFNAPNVLGGGDNRLLQVLEAVRRYREEGVPVHCIGLQAYMRPGYLTPERMAHELGALGGAGLPLHVSEFAFRGERDAYTVSTLSEAQQAERFRTWLPLWFSHPALASATMWGIWDTRQLYVQGSGLYRADGSAKPAEAVVRQLVTVDWNTTLEWALGAGAGRLGLLLLVAEEGLAFRAYCGSYVYRAVLSDGREVSGTFEVPGPAGAAACSPPDAPRRGGGPGPVLWQKGELKGGAKVGGASREGTHVVTIVVH